MRLLLDTHILVWLIEAPGQMRREESDALKDAVSLHLSVISIWELRIKWQQRHPGGQRKGPLDPALALAALEPNAIGLEELTGDDCVTPLDPPIRHKDPFDEMLLVHAQRLGARLLTRDRLLAGHPLALVP